MEQGYARITVCFEAPFWIGVLEREWGGTLEVCKIVFGAEPRDYEVYAFLMSHWRELRFSPPVTGVRRAEAANPKRARRQARNRPEKTGAGTKAQQALQLPLLLLRQTAGGVELRPGGGEGRGHAVLLGVLI